MRKISLSKHARKCIEKLPPKQKRQVVECILALGKDIQPHDAKKLHGYEYYRVDSGEYRIIYYWDDAQVFVVLVGKRNDSDVYRRFRRMA